MARKWWTLVAVCLGMLMLLIDTTVVNVALPSIARDLGSSFSDLQWTVDAYALSLAALILVSGSLSDLLGARRIFVTGLVIFTAASLLCGLASSPLFLNACRAVQGIGGAAMLATSLALLGRAFSGHDRGVALGIWGATVGAAVAVGPLVGGALVSGSGWRWVFFVNLPIGAVTLLVASTRVSETSRRPVHPDWIGAVTFSGALFAVVFALIRGNVDGWASPRVIAAFIAGGLLAALFLAVEATRREPMLDLRLFRKPAVVGATLASLAVAASLFSMFLYLSLYMQDGLGYSAFDTGLRFLPATLAVLAIAPVAGRLSSRVPVRLLLGGGLALVGTGLALQTGVSVTSGWTALLAGFVVAGIGNGMFQPARGSAALGTVPPERSGLGSGLNNTALQVGTAAGIAGLGAIFQGRYNAILSEQLARLGRGGHALALHATAADPGGGVQRLPAGARALVLHAVRAAYAGGLDRSLWVAAAVALLGGAASLVLVRQRDFVAAPAGRAAPSWTPTPAHD